MQLEVGQRVNDYDILSVLGAGGMGRVYCVRNIISGRTEAMKVLLPDLTADRALAERFISEIRTLASFDHPNIAQLRTAFLHENQLVMVMEFVEGVTLEQQAKKGTMPVSEVVGYISQTLSALAYAHGRGVVHRDIKPANMMVTSHGVVKLMDFGIAKSSNEPQLTRPGTTIGSMYYMSPEQVRGDTIDARSDIYSVGITLYELLAGRKPFSAESTFSILNQQLNETPKPLVEVNPAVPKGLSDIVQLALAKDSSHRFQSADAFRNSLRPYLKTEDPGTTWVTAPLASPAPSIAAAAVSAAQFAPASSSPPSPGSGPVATPVPEYGPVSTPGLQPGAEYVTAPPQPVQAQAKSRRGLWIGLGAAAAILAVVLAITILPRMMTTHAANDGGPAPTPTTAASSVAAPAPPPSTSSAASSPSPTSPTPPAMQPETPPAPTPTAAVAASAVPSPSAVGSAKVRPVYTPASNTGKATSHTVASDMPPMPSPQPSGNSQQALDAASERLTQVQARSGAVNESIDRLRRQQEQSGYGLRGDISAAVSRMNAYEANAGRALAEKNAASADKSLDQAERELDTLEKFLGR